MKITILNGAARKGNTYTLVNAFAKGASEKNEVEIIEAGKLNLDPCIGCETCRCEKGCIAKEDTNPTVDKIVASDMIVFASPVYWWGISGQLKLLIDKCYCKGKFLQGKKIGLIITGADAIDTVQYDMIKKQFDCMADYLNWDFVFYNKYSASARLDIASRTDVIDDITALGASL